jgi:hypothetical protein
MATTDTHITFRKSLFVGSKSLHVFSDETQIGVILPCNGGFVFKAKGQSHAGDWHSTLEDAQDEVRVSFARAEA